ncbi:unnamed protein product [Adineta steineri]|uniref:Major facilitator superfamily (MFS) profile domain-containing protein n=1 Tax=Adineta steineri TaxID=433720 RepID=A0A814V7W4_9BILA|nr:unnamed protein product [Adineta steineri]
MAKGKDTSLSINANERSSLLNNRLDDSIHSSRRESIRARSSSSVNEATKKQRFRDIRICYFGMFVSSIVFSITVSSLWPFLQIIDTTSEATFLGWLVAAFSIGQLIASPLIGYITNQTNKNTMPLVISTALIAASNILYAYVQSINNVGMSNKWWLMLSRFIMGIGAGLYLLHLIRSMRYIYEIFCFNYFS